MNQNTVQLHLGDLFESQADTLVIPCSTAGTMSTPFINGLKRLGFSIPTLPTGELGAVQDHLKEQYPSTLNRKIIFAISVDNQSSSYGTIEKIVYQLANRTHDSDSLVIACPLFGTGAGNLQAQEVLRIMRETFERSSRADAKLIICITDKKIYNQLIQEQPRSSTTLSAGWTFYAAGAMWSGEDQYERFMANNIWENGHTNNFTREVNRVKPEDIIVLKYSSDDDGGYLRIKALGRVVENFNDGHRLKVNWNLRDLNVKIQGLSRYRDTISPMRIEDAAYLEERLAEAGIHLAVQEEQPTLDNNSLLINVPSRIANLIADATTGMDYLDIGKDVNAFARVMAYQKFSPPLAIALFGKWGTGKSFFMQKLRDRIDELTKRKGQQDYCVGIAQIHFNAWSYLDANLWASLVSRIFEGLQEYITGDTLAKEHQKDILAKLTSQLVITYEEKSEFEAKKIVTEKKIEALEKEQRDLREKLDKQIADIQNHSLNTLLDKVDKEFNVKVALANAFDENKSVAENKEELKKIIPEKYWENPEEYYKQLRSTATFLQAFFQKKNIGWNLAFVAFILMCIFLLPHLLADVRTWLISHDFSVPQLQTLASIVVLMTPTIIRAKAVIEKYKPFIASVWHVKEKHQQALAKAKDDFLQKEKSIQLEIRDGEQQIQTINQQLQQAETELQHIDYKIKNTLATEALYSFIEKRVKSEDYQKMLGIVSIIRKDFETLSSLFSGHRAEQAKELDEKFERPLSRIILYIDDLDRCPEDRVVEVLEAVNLLMAFPLFIVVVGVDPRWVRNALVKRYNLQFSTHEDQAGDRRYERLEASDYLEKIFQIPFHLKPASAGSVKQMIFNLTGGITVAIQHNEKQQTEEYEDIYVTADNPLSDQLTTDLKQIKQDIKTTVELSDTEIRYLQEMSVVVGNNPRAIKRFVNTYQIVRGHGGFSYMKEEQEREFLVCLFLLALPTGKYRDICEAFVKFFEYHGNESKTLNQFLATTFKTGNSKTDELKHQLDVALTDSPDHATLQKQLSSVFKHHYQFIRRFTFEDVDI